MGPMGTENLLEALHRRIFSCYGLPRTIVSDRGGQMISQLWQRICQRYGIKSKLSSAHHPETDGQTENANKVMKNYLRAYVKYSQDDWVDFLPDAEFAANNHINTSTGMTPFFADHGYHPRSGIEPPHSYDDSGTRRAELRRADAIIERQEAINKYLRERLITAQDDQQKHANVNRQPHPDYNVGDMVYVDAKDFVSGRQSKSLSSKNVGPWKIIHNINGKAYELDIPANLKEAGLTPIFHPWKLQLAPTDPFPGQIQSPQPPLMVKSPDEDVEHEEWELLEVVDCRNTRKGVQYKATYIGPYEEWNNNPPWQPWSDFTNSKDAVLRFHRENPTKPEPPVELSDMN